MSIIIFSRAIRSGKTTELQQWCADRNNVAGVLMPDVDGVRHFQNIFSGELFRAESVDENEMNIVKIGKYSFVASAFEKANQVILDAMQELPETMVIDEIGKLELQEAGLYKASKKAIETYKQPCCFKTLLMVVRADLLPEVVSTFHITNYLVLDTLTHYKIRVKK